MLKTIDSRAVGWKRRACDAHWGGTTVVMPCRQTRWCTIHFGYLSTSSAWSMTFWAFFSLFHDCLQFFCKSCCLRTLLSFFHDSRHFDGRSCCLRASFLRETEGFFPSLDGCVLRTLGRHNSVEWCTVRRVCFHCPFYIAILKWTRYNKPNYFCNEFPSWSQVFDENIFDKGIFWLVKPVPS